MIETADIHKGVFQTQMDLWWAFYKPVYKFNEVLVRTRLFGLNDSWHTSIFLQVKTAVYNQKE